MVPSPPKSSWFRDIFRDKGTVEGEDSEGGAQQCELDADVDVDIPATGHKRKPRSLEDVLDDMVDQDIEDGTVVVTMKSSSP